MNKQDLMLIESSGKIKTITQILESMNLSVRILSTGGHIKKLSSRKFGGFGFDVKNPENIEWEIPRTAEGRGRKSPLSIVQEIKKAANAAEKIYIATDKDREGEGIAWQLYQELGKKNQPKCSRVIFNSITRTSIEDSLKTFIPINKDRASAFFARRLLDRYIGFKLSKFVQMAVDKGSAGRVQSIALKFVRDRDLEIASFKESVWFVIKCLYKGCTLRLKEVAKGAEELYDFQKTGKKRSSSGVEFSSLESAEKFIKSLGKFKFLSASEPELNHDSPPLPLKTSSLMNLAGKKLGFSPKEVSVLSQKLYEGIDVDGSHIALITYPRTDRCDYSTDFVASANEFITHSYGKEFLNENPTFQIIQKDESIQGAHEAIRPIDLLITPKTLKKNLSEDQFALYQLIWAHTIISLCTPASYLSRKYLFDNNGHSFSGLSSWVSFPGWRKIIDEIHPGYSTASSRVRLPEMQKGDEAVVETLEVAKEKNIPPPLYNPRRLINDLEAKKIGRSSTYASYPEKIMNRGYVIKKGASFVLTEMGRKVADLLNEGFQAFINYDYTRQMDEQLKDIEDGKLKWTDFLRKIIQDFDNAHQSVKKRCFKCYEVIHEEVENKIFKSCAKIICLNCQREAMSDKGPCPQCGSELVLKAGRFGEFTSCSGYPDCKYIHRELENIDRTCPRCSSSLAQVKGKEGHIVCSDSPSCDYTERDDLIDRKCPQCSLPLSKKNGRFGPFVSCSGYPKCRYIEKTELKTEKVEGKCPQCSGGLVSKRGRFGPFVSCSGYPKCKYIQKNK